MESKYALSKGLGWFFWGALLVIIDIWLTIPDYYTGATVSFDFLPDLIGFVLVILGAYYVFTQHLIFGRFFKFFVFVLPFTAMVGIANIVIQWIIPYYVMYQYHMQASQMTGYQMWQLFAIINEMLFFLCLIGIGWKISALFVPKNKLAWAMVLVLDLLLDLFAISAMTGNLLIGVFWTAILLTLIFAVFLLCLLRDTKKCLFL